MKKSIFTLMFLCFITLAFAQNIADVSVSSSGRLTALDASNHEISSKYLGYGELLAGYSSAIIVLKSSSGRISVYNEKFGEIASRYLGYGESIKNVSGNFILIKNTSGRVTTYDKNFKEISSRYE